MARMIQLTPPPKADIGPGPFALVATDAGRYAKGLQFTTEVWKDSCLDSALVIANKLDDFVTTMSPKHGLPQDDVRQAVLDLIVAVEGLMRARRSQRPTGAVRPEIEITPEITEVADQTETALRQAGSSLYQHSRRLVTIAAGVTPPKGLKRPDGLPLISPMTAPRLAEEAARAARFYTWQEGEKAYCRPPAWLMQTLLARTERSFAQLEAIVHAPTLRPDGSLLAVEGYDPDTGLYVDFGGVTYPSIPLAPSRDAARQAITLLADPLRDFPFAEPCHKSTALAMLLTVLCRHFLQESIPLGSITAHTQGSGKSYLAQVIALIGTGRACTFWPQPASEEEERKRLLAIGLEGDAVVCIDNIMRPFGSGTFANVLTSMVYGDRILGVSQNAQVRFHCVWLATGNNITYVGEMVRRVVPIVIDPKLERPEERTNYQYADLLTHVRSVRSQLVAAALTIMLAYITAGCPRQTTTNYGGFGEWYRHICGALIWLGEEDPYQGRAGLQADVEDELLNFRQLVLCWQACYSAVLATPRTLKNVLADIKHNASVDQQNPNEWDDLREALGAFDKTFDGQHLDVRGAGYALRKHQGTVVDRKRFVPQPHTKQGVPWVMEVL